MSSSSNKQARFGHRVHVKAQRGLSLIEVLVAMAILAWIMAISQVVIQTAGRAGEISEKQSQALKDIDRLWVLMETDLRNTVAQNYTPQFGTPLPAMIVAQTDDYNLYFLRAGQANPLLLPRSEVLRVGYRVEDEILWRDTWIDPYNPLPENARAQQLYDGIERFEVLALPPAPTGRSISQGPWLDQWPGEGQGNAILPLALDIKLTFSNGRELNRIITLVGGSGPLPTANGNGNDANNPDADEEDDDS